MPYLIITYFGRQRELAYYPLKYSSNYFWDGDDKNIFFVRRESPPSSLRKKKYIFPYCLACADRAGNFDNLTFFSLSNCFS